MRRHHRTFISPTVIDDEMLSFLNAVVALSGNTLLDLSFTTYAPDKLTAEWAKDEADRNETANALIARVDKSCLREIYQSPVQRFVTDMRMAILESKLR